MSRDQYRTGVITPFQPAWPHRNLRLSARQAEIGDSLWPGLWRGISLFVFVGGLLLSSTTAPIAAQELRFDVLTDVNKNDATYRKYLQGAGDAELRQATELADRLYGVLGSKAKNSRLATLRISWHIFFQPDYRKFIEDYARARKSEGTLSDVYLRNFAHPLTAGTARMLGEPSEPGGGATASQIAKAGRLLDKARRGELKIWDYIEGFDFLEAYWQSEAARFKMLDEDIKARYIYESTNVSSAEAANPLIVSKDFYRVLALGVLGDPEFRKVVEGVLDARLPEAKDLGNVPGRQLQVMQNALETCSERDLRQLEKSIKACVNSELQKQLKRIQILREPGAMTERSKTADQATREKQEESWRVRVSEAWELNADLVEQTRAVRQFTTIGATLLRLSDDQDTRQTGKAIFYVGGFAADTLDSVRRLKLGELASEISSGSEYFNQAQQLRVQSFSKFEFSVNLVANAVSLVFNLLGIGGPSPEEVILERLRDFQLEVRAMHREVMSELALIRSEQLELFDKALLQLDLLSRTMVGEFDEAHWERMEIQASVLSVQEELADLRDYVRELLHDRAKEDFSQTITDYDLAKTEPQRADSNKVDAWASYFFRVGSDTCRTSAWAGGKADLRPRRAFVPGRAKEQTIPCFVQSWRTWDYVNDYLFLAQAPRPFYYRESTLDEPEKFVNSVNPIHWSEAVRHYLAIANRWPDLVLPGKESTVSDNRREQLEKRLAILYLRGEELRQSLFGLSATGQGDERELNRALWSDLVTAELRAIDTFESAVTAMAGRRAAKLGNANIFAGVDGLDLTPGETIGLKEDAQQWRLQLSNGKLGGMNLPQYLREQKEDVQAIRDTLMFSRDEALALEEMLPATYRRAHALTLGQNFPQLGVVELRLSRMEFSETSRRYDTERSHRGDDVSATIMGTLKVEVLARFNRSNSAYTNTIWRTELDGGSPVHFETWHDLRLAHIDESELSPGMQVYKRVQDATGVFYTLTTYPGEPESPPPTAIPTNGLGTQQAPEWFVPEEVPTEADRPTKKEHHPKAYQEAVKLCWPMLKSELLSPSDGAFVGGTDSSLPGENTDEWRQMYGRQLELAFSRAAFDFDYDQLYAKKEIGDEGKAIRDLLGIKYVSQNMAFLAMPRLLVGSTKDPQLVDALWGEGAVYSSKGFAEALAATRPGGGKEGVPLVMQDRQGNWTSPYAQQMRRRAIELETRLNDALERTRQTPELREHPIVENTLVEILLFAEKHGLDLEKVFERMDVEPQDNWVISRLRAARQLIQFSDPSKELGSLNPTPLRR